MNKRTCGTCHACCIHVPVRAFNKPTGVPCEHLLPVITEAGACGCYDERPSECQRFRCSWLESKLKAELKPDACGVVLETGFIEHPRRLTFLIGFEHERGAVLKHRKLWAKSAPRGTAIQIVEFGHGRIFQFGHADDIAALEQFMEHCRKVGGVSHQFSDGVVEHSRLL